MCICIAVCIVYCIILHHHQLHHQCTCSRSGAAHCCTAAQIIRQQLQTIATIVKNGNNCNIWQQMHSCKYKTQQLNSGGNNCKRRQQLHSCKYKRQIQSYKKKTFALWLATFAPSASSSAFSGPMYPNTIKLLCQRKTNIKVMLI